MRIQVRVVDIEKNIKDLEVACSSCCSCLRCPLGVAIVNGRCLSIKDGVNPGHPRE